MAGEIDIRMRREEPLRNKGTIFRRAAFVLTVTAVMVGSGTALGVQPAAAVTCRSNRSTPDSAYSLCTPFLLFARHRVKVTCGGAPAQLDHLRALETLRNAVHRDLLGQ